MSTDEQLAVALAVVGSSPIAVGAWAGPWWGAAYAAALAATALVSWAVVSARSRAAIARFLRPRVRRLTCAVHRHLLRPATSALTSGDRR